MSNSTQFIQQRVLKNHDSKVLVDVYALALELQDHCSEMTTDEIAGIIGTQVATIKAAAVWRKPS